MSSSWITVVRLQVRKKLRTSWASDTAIFLALHAVQAVALFSFGVFLPFVIDVATDYSPEAAIAAYTLYGLFVLHVLRFASEGTSIREKEALLSVPFSRRSISLYVVARSLTNRLNVGTIQIVLGCGLGLYLSGGAVEAAYFVLSATSGIVVSNHVHLVTLAYLAPSAVILLGVGAGLSVFALLALGSAGAAPSVSTLLFSPSADQGVFLVSLAGCVGIVALSTIASVILVKRTLYVEETETSWSRVVDRLGFRQERKRLLSRRGDGGFLGVLLRGLTRSTTLRRYLRPVCVFWGLWLFLPLALPIGGRAVVEPAVTILLAWLIPASLLSVSASMHGGHVGVLVQHVTPRSFARGYIVAGWALCFVCAAPVAAVYAVAGSPASGAAAGVSILLGGGVFGPLSVYASLYNRASFPLFGDMPSGFVQNRWELWLLGIGPLIPYLIGVSLFEVSTALWTCAVLGGLGAAFTPLWINLLSSTLRHRRHRLFQHFHHDRDF